MNPEEHQATPDQLRPQPRSVDLAALVARINSRFDRPLRNMTDREREGRCVHLFPLGMHCHNQEENGS